MPALRDYQRAIAASLVSGDTGTAAALIDRRNPPADRLHIHRNTMLTALANALALTYPAVRVLVGEAFFSRAARAFIQAEPPRAALLSHYGGAFPGFLARYEPAHSLAYLPDVARLEWVVAYTAQASDDGPALADVDLGGARLTLAPSLMLLEARYPAESIWRAALNQDGEALSRIDMTQANGILAVWREGDGAAVSTLGPGAGAFLAELLAGGHAGIAIGAAAAADPEGDPIAAITHEVLSAGFARLAPASP